MALKDNHTKLSRKKYTLEALMKHANSISENTRENRIKNNFWSNGRKLRACSVYAFMDAFISDRIHDELVRGGTHRWIAACIEAMFGEVDTKTMSIGELATTIGSALNRSEISDEDRWALYELCFLLTAEMSPFKIGLGLEDMTSRMGTPDIPESQSLYNRAQAIWDRKSPKEEPKRSKRMSLDQLLARADFLSLKFNDKDTVKLPHIRTVTFFWTCATVKYDADPSAYRDIRKLLIKEHRFQQMVKMYSGEDWDDGLGLMEFAGKITQGFKDRTLFGFMDRVEVLQAYELCYEFISLLADASCDERHKSLMIHEGYDKGYDVDAYEKEWTKAAIEEMEARNNAV